VREKRGEVRFEHIGLDDLHLRLGTELEAQFGGQGSVDFDCDQPSTAAGKDRRDGAVARADLYHGTVTDGAE